MTLGLPVVGIPGETYVYNTGGSPYGLVVTVARAAGKPLEDHAADTLFRPLASPGDWMRSPQRGGQRRVRARADRARHAQAGTTLSTKRGVGRGADHRRGVRGRGDDVAERGGLDGRWAGYGYQWWITATEAGYPAYFALGYGGSISSSFRPRSRRGRGNRAATGPRGAADPRYLIESIAAAMPRSVTSRRAAMACQSDAGGTSCWVKNDEILVPRDDQPRGNACYRSEPVVFPERACGRETHGREDRIMDADSALTTGQNVRDDETPAGSARLYPDLATPGATHRDDGRQWRVGLGDRSGRCASATRLSPA